ncbi:unnamed protein product, partial [Cyprideis torosa]
MLAEPELQLSRISQALGLAQPSAEALEEYSGDYLDKELRHAEYTLEDLQSEPALPGGKLLGTSTRLVSGRPPGVSDAVLKLVKRSGVFDETWYMQGFSADQQPEHPLHHYLSAGWKEGYEPSVLFDGKWYLSFYPDVKAAGICPLRHYLEQGWKEGRQPHPAFDGAWYLRFYDDVQVANISPLQHYIRYGAREGRRPNKFFDVEWFVKKYSGKIESPETNGALFDEGIKKSFDQALAAEFCLKVRRAEFNGVNEVRSPLVSIVMPTHNRQSKICSAIDSVLQQSYANWELLIIDDGSEDDTCQLVRESYSDSRISIKRIEASGVCRARNAALERAKGELIAYLDSDNAWVVDFLEVMVAYLQQEAADFAYAAIRMQNESGTSYRYREFSGTDLLIKNFVDLNAILHKRELYDQQGGFNEALSRMVDWDLIIRYTKSAKVVSAPFVGVNYDNHKQPDRITVKEPKSWRYAIMNQHLIDWDKLVSEVGSREKELVSVIIPVYGQVDLTRKCVLSLLQVPSGRPFEVILVDNGSDYDVLEELFMWSEGNANISLVRNPENLNFALGCNIGFAHARGARVVFLNNDTEVTSGWLDKLISSLQGDVGAVQPKLVYPDGRIQCAGIVFSERSSIGFPIYADFPAELPAVNCSRKYQAITAACMAVNSADFARLRGFDPLYVNGQEDVDFCLRLAELGKACWYEADSMVIHHESRTPGRGQFIAQNRLLFDQRWSDRLVPDAEQYFQADGYRVLLESLGVDLNRLELLVDPVVFEDVAVPEQGWLVNGTVLHPGKDLYRLCSAGETRVVNRSLSLFELDFMRVFNRYLEDPQHATRVVLGLMNKILIGVFYVLLSASFVVDAGERLDSKATGSEKAVGAERLETIEKRFKDRWQALIDREFETAYGYESPAYRNSVDLPAYVASYHPGLTWTSVAVDEVKIEDEAKAALNTLDAEVGGGTSAGGTVDFGNNSASGNGNADGDSGNEPATPSTPHEPKLGVTDWQQAPEPVYIGEIHHQPGGITTYYDRDPYHIACEEMVWLAYQTGLEAEYIECPSGKIVYVDEDVIDAFGVRSDPYFKPDWNPDLFYSQDYISSCYMCCSQWYLENKQIFMRYGQRLALSYLLPSMGDEEILHLPVVLAHAEDKSSDDLQPGMREKLLKESVLGVESVNAIEVPGYFRLNYEIPDPAPLVSLLIPTRDGLSVLKPCVESILEHTSYLSYEILILDNQSSDVETLKWLAFIASNPKVRVLSFDKPFNYSAINNFGVRHAKGSVIGLINNDIEVISSGWLREMVSHACRPEIGCVGAKLYYSDGRIQHAGVVLGLGDVAGHVHRFFSRDANGYHGRLKLVQNYSAVTAACLLVRRSIFEEVGGLEEEHLMVAYNDVDFCLRVRAAGYRNLWTPFAELYHHESVSRGKDNTPEKRLRYESEVAYMKQEWCEELHKDPCYNPNLSLRWRQQFDHLPTPAVDWNNPVITYLPGTKSHDRDFQVFAPGITRFLNDHPQ